MSSYSGFTGCSIEREYTVGVPEHVIYLAFNDDEGAEAFDEWWSSEGQKEFAHWLDGNEEYKSQARYIK